MDRFAALGQIESGNNDLAIGPNGEITRYQIRPKVWNEYRPLCHFVADPKQEFSAHMIGILIMRDRLRNFAISHHRQPSDLEWYLLWNCPADVDHPSRRERARAQRFANLCSKP